MNHKKILYIIVPITLFAMLAVCVEAGITVGFERWAYVETTEDLSPGLTAVMKAITHIGDPFSVIALCLLLFAVPKSRRTIALPVSIATIVSALLNAALKNIFTRQRPDMLRLINETGYSFPSGHAMINATFYTMLIFLICKYVKNTNRKILLSALCVFLALGIGCSRVYLGVHYAGDVLGGWLIGFAVSMASYLVWDKLYQFHNG